MTSWPERARARTPSRLPMVPLGTNSAASFPISAAARSWSRFTVGSSPKTSSPSSASAMARRISGVGMVTVSERRSMVTTGPLCSSPGPTIAPASSPPPAREPGPRGADAAAPAPERRILAGKLRSVPTRAGGVEPERRGGGSERRARSRRRRPGSGPRPVHGPVGPGPAVGGAVRSSREETMSRTFEKASIATELAHRMIEAAERKAAAMGKPMVIAIVDESGVLKALSRMDGAPLLSLQVAQDKAYTAVGFGMPTEAWHPFIKDDPPLAAGAVGGIDRLVVFGGGYPIVLDGKIVGGIGVSGGHYTDDMEVARAGLAVLDAAL